MTGHYRYKTRQTADWGDLVQEHQPLKGCSMRCTVTGIYQGQGPLVEAGYRHTKACPNRKREDETVSNRELLPICALCTLRHAEPSILRNCNMALKDELNRWRTNPVYQIAAEYTVMETRKVIRDLQTVLYAPETTFKPGYEGDSLIETDESILEVMSAITDQFGNLARARDGILKYDAMLEKWTGYIAAPTNLQADIKVWEGTSRQLIDGANTVIQANRDRWNNPEWRDKIPYWHAPEIIKEKGE